MKHRICRSAMVSLCLLSPLLLAAGQAQADSRQDAQTLIEKLRRAGAAQAVPDEMRSLESAFASAEQSQAGGNGALAEQYYVMVIQKGRLVELAVERARPAEAPAAAAPASPATSAGPAVTVSVDATSLLGVQRRDVTGAGAETLLPLTQFLALDVENLASSNLTAHFYGWGRYDLADNSYNSDTGAGSLSYGYLRYRFDYANADIRAGRHTVREGIINEQLDGLSVRSDLPGGFGISAFGGAVVHGRHLQGEASDGKGELVGGGRLSYRYKGVFEAGGAAVLESSAPTLIAHDSGTFRRYGLDLWLAPHRMVDLAGHSSYNPETKRVAEHSYLLNVRPLEHLSLSGEFNEHHERSYLYSWSLLSGAGLDPSDTSRSVGMSVAYQVLKPLELVVDYKHYSRTLGSADRYGFDAKLMLMDNTLRGGIGYHCLQAGEQFAITPYTSASYQELRAWAMRDTKGYFASVDLLGYFFSQAVHGETSAWEAALSLGYHITPDLAVSGDISHGRNPQFTDETKGLLRLTYNMTYAGKGGKK